MFDIQPASFSSICPKVCRSRKQRLRLIEPRAEGAERGSVTVLENTKNQAPDKLKGPSSK
jgi:hypothetical protein